MPLIYRKAERPLKKTTLTSYRAELRASLQSTLNLLSKEIKNLCGYDANCVIELNIDPSAIRPRSGISGRPYTPEVRIIIPTEDKGNIEMECSAFPTWHSNLRGIAMTLERLRLVNLYDCAGQGQAYAGFKQLTNSAMMLGNSDPVADKAWAENFLNEHSGGAGYGLDAWRICVKRTHPDAPGGSQELFKKTQEAKTILKL